MSTVISKDSSGHLTSHEITTHELDCQTVTTTYDNGYFSKVSLDGNSNMIVEWSHGQGKGRISIPYGECYEIFRALEVLQANGQRLMDQTKYFKEIKT